MSYAVPLAVGAGAVTTAWLLWRRASSSPKLDMPYLQFEGDNSPSRYMTETDDLLAKGYEKYTKHGLPFCMRNPVDDARPIVILPFKYLPEVRSAPQDQLSLPLHLDKNSILRHIGGPQMTDEIIHVAKLDLNRALNKLIEPMQHECVAAFKKQIPPCPDWTPLPPYPLILVVFSYISARVLVGPDLCGDDWHQLSQQYVTTVLKAPSVVRAKYHPSFYWLAKYFNPVVKEVLKYRRQAGELLRPVLAARIAEADAKVKGADRADEDAVQWLVEAHRAKGRNPTPDDVAQDLFVLITASMHSTSATALATLFDLIDHPDSLAEIREEIRKVQNQHPTWSRQALGELRILDSFMRESLRVHTVTQLTVGRMVAKPWTFQDGLRLPVGTQLSFPCYRYNLDSDVHADAATFDAKRHLRKRQETDPTKFHFASTGDDTINWGSGTHACPGRFLAQEALKLILIYLVTNYEFKLPEEGQKRPPEMKNNFNLIPNVMTPILFKERAA